jgi:hypothetical protein
MRDNEMFKGAGAETRSAQTPGDFRGWKEHDTYRKAFDRLLRNLRVENTQPGRANR